MEFEERPRDCSPGHAGKEGLHLAMTDTFVSGLRFPRSPGARHSNVLALTLQFFFRRYLEIEIPVLPISYNYLYLLIESKVRGS